MKRQNENTITEPAPKRQAPNPEDLLYNEACTLKDINPKAAFDKFLLAANKNHVKAIYELALCYRHGRGTKQNEEQAITFFIKAAEAGDAESNYEVGYALEFLYRKKHPGLLINYPISEDSIYFFFMRSLIYAKNEKRESYNNIPWYKDTCFKVAQCERDGRGTMRDIAKAYHHFVEAIDAGRRLEANAQAGFLLSANREEIFPEKSKTDIDKLIFEHFKLFDLHEDHPSGLFGLGTCYYDGVGVTVDIAKAVGYYTKSANLGNSGAQFRLAQHYEALGNHDVAFNLYFSGSDFNPEAFYKLAFYIEQFYAAKDFRHHKPGHEISPEVAYKFYKKAADLGHTEAIFKQSQCQESGYGVRQNKKAACQGYMAYAAYAQTTPENVIDARYNAGLLLLDNCTNINNHEQAAFQQFLHLKNSKHAKGLYKLAECYKYGRGASRNLRTAFTYFKKSADLGLAEAQLEMFFCHRDALGTEKDVKTALEYCKKAYDQDYMPAVYQSALNILKRSSKTSTEAATAISLLEKASETVDEAFLALGDCYMNGDGVTKNEEQAIQYYKISYEKKSPVGAYKLGLYYRQQGHYTQAHDCLLFAVKEDVEAAFFYLGESIKNGWGIFKKKEDKEKEMYNLFKKAAEKSHPEGMYHLGWCYEQGIGCDSDLEKELASPKLKDRASISSKNALALKKAFGLYQDALQKDPNLGQASFALGLCYFHGKGTIIDRNEACKLLISATQKGIDEAYFELARLYESLGDSRNASACFLKYAQAIQEKRSIFLNHYEEEKNKAPQLKRSLLPADTPDVLHALLMSSIPSIQKSKQDTPTLSDEEAGKLLLKTARMFSGVVERLHPENTMPVFRLFSASNEQLCQRKVHEDHFQPKTNPLIVEIYLKEALKKKVSEAALRLGDFYSGISFTFGTNVFSPEHNIATAITFYEQGAEMNNAVAKARLQDSSVLLKQAIVTEIYAMRAVEKRFELLKQVCDRYEKLIQDLTDHEETSTETDKTNLKIAKSKVPKVQHTLGMEYEKRANEANEKKSDKLFSNANEHISLMDEARKYYKKAADAGYTPPEKSVENMNSKVDLTPTPTVMR